MTITKVTTQPTPTAPPPLEFTLSRKQGRAGFNYPQVLDLINIEAKGADLTAATNAGAIALLDHFIDIARDRCIWWGDATAMPPLDEVREKDAIAAGTLMMEHLQEVDQANTDTSLYSEEVEEDGRLFLKVSLSTGLLILREPMGIDTRKASKAAKKGLIYTNCTKIALLTVKYGDRSTINMAELQKLSWGDYFKVQYALANFPGD